MPGRRAAWGLVPNSNADFSGRTAKLQYAKLPQPRTIEAAQRRGVRSPAMLIGQRLRELREAKKLSQGDIEKRTGLLRCYTSRVANTSP
jgi:hypothetical protein